MESQQRLDARERRQLDELGYVVRERAFDAAELAQIRADCEALVRRVTAASVGRRKIALGSYMFQLEKDLVTMVKWEPAHPDVVQVFTEKLNVKRARTGGPIVLHQDYPYWTDLSDGAADIATAILFLDDANRANGCVEVLPGSHKRGVWPRKQVGGFGSNEMELEGFDESRLVALEVPAGTALYFGSVLVHRSLPNRTDRDRRALLFSYQPAGRRQSIESFMKLAGR